MPQTNKIWTLNDMSGAGGKGTTATPGAAVASSSASTRNNKGFSDEQMSCLLKCFHIPTLPGADQAKAMLTRVVREFTPIVKRRGYRVLTVSEICCCNDGLDFEEEGGKRRRKRRKVSNDIWGYNQTTTSRYGKSHTIHLRLRHAADHSRFHCYEDVAGTMAHELAHCEVGPHNDKFNKLMDTILEEHAVLMASNLTFGGASMPSFGGKGRALGGGDRNVAQIRKQQQSENHAGYKLGGDGSFKWMTPAEAAVVAAEARRRQQVLRQRGDRWCRPCTITLDDSDDEEALEESSVAAEDRKMPARPLETTSKRNLPNEGRRGGDKKRVAKGTSAPAIDAENFKPTKSKAVKPSKGFGSQGSSNAVCIDLTSDNDDKSTNPRASSLAQWACTRCTFLNQSIALSCDMCRMERAL